MLSDRIMRSRCKPMEKVAQHPRQRRQDLLGILDHLSNGRLEAMNTRLRLLTRLAFGFHSAPRSCQEPQKR